MKVIYVLAFFTLGLGIIAGCSAEDPAGKVGSTQQANSLCIGVNGVVLSAEYCIDLAPGGPPHWGSFADNGCEAPNARKMSAIIWDVPAGQSWEQACRSTPGFGGRLPNRCINNGLNEWGEWDVQDSTCGP